MTGAVLVAVGTFAAWRSRSAMPEQAPAQRARLAAMALACGAMLGLANFGANAALMAIDPVISRLLTEHVASQGRLPTAAFASAPVMEEIALRLFFMSVVAWIVSRFTRSARTIFLVALAISAVVFGVLHLGRAFPTD